MFGNISIGGSLLIDTDDKITGWPFAYIEGFLVPDRLTLFAGINKKVIKNNYMTLAKINPYLNAPNTEFRNSFKEERFVGFKGGINPYISYNLKGFQEISKQHPLFVLNETDSLTFVVAYDSSLVTVGGQLEFNAEVSKFFGTGISFRYNSYSNQTEAEAWHLPVFDANWYAHYSPFDKLYLSGDFIFLSGLKGRTTDGNIKKLKPAIDLNLAAKYRILDNLALFCTVNNIASVKYERFINYKTYGLNVVGGLIFR